MIVSLDRPYFIGLYAMAYIDINLIKVCPNNPMSILTHISEIGSSVVEHASPSKQSGSCRNNES